MTRPRSTAATARASAAPRRRDASSRARYPDATGFVERDGVRVVLGGLRRRASPTDPAHADRGRSSTRATGRPQIPYLARHCRVITFDGRGNGRSDRPTDPRRTRHAEFAADALAVMDATGTERAVLVGAVDRRRTVAAPRGRASRARRAARPSSLRPCRWPPAEPRARRDRAFEEPRDDVRRLGQVQPPLLASRLRRLPRVLLRAVLTEPHSTKQDRGQRRLGARDGRRDARRHASWRRRLRDERGRAEALAVRGSTARSLVDPRHATTTCARRASGARLAELAHGRAGRRSRGRATSPMPATRCRSTCCSATSSASGRRDDDGDGRCRRGRRRPTPTRARPPPDRPASPRRPTASGSPSTSTAPATPTLVLLPSTPIVHSRQWKGQVPYLSRHYRVVDVRRPRQRPLGPADRPRRLHRRRGSSATSRPSWTRPAPTRAVLVGLCGDGVWRADPARRVATRSASRGIVAFARRRPAPVAAAPVPVACVRSTTTARRTRAGPRSTATTGGATTRASPASSSRRSRPSRTRRRRSTTPSSGRSTVGRRDARRRAAPFDARPWRRSRRPAARSAARCSSSTAPRTTASRVARAARLAELTGAPLVIVEGADHMIPGRHPVLANLLIRDFVRSLEEVRVMTASGTTTWTRALAATAARAVHLVADRARARPCATSRSPTSCASSTRTSRSTGSPSTRSPRSSRRTASGSTR